MVHQLAHRFPSLKWLPALAWDGSLLESFVWERASALTDVNAFCRARSYDIGISVTASESTAATEGFPSLRGAETVKVPLSLGVGNFRPRIEASGVLQVHHVIQKLSCPRSTVSVHVARNLRLVPGVSGAPYATIERLLVLFRVNYV